MSLNSSPAAVNEQRTSGNQRQATIFYYKLLMTFGQSQPLSFCIFPLPYYSCHMCQNQHSRRCCDFARLQTVSSIIFYTFNCQLHMGKLIENYSLQNQIGHGTYSTVFRALHLKTNQEVAVKQVRAQKFKQYPKLQEGTYNEISILTNLEPSPHIIKYFDMLKTVHNFYFVYQYCNGGTLETLLKDKKHLPEKQALTYFAQILQAFRVLNRHNIMHRDLKPQNILLHDGIIKLADFGFCKPLQSEDEISMTMLGSPIYMAPEILRGESYSMKADIWSLGVVLFRMLYGYCPFESSNIGQLIMLIDEQDLKVPQKPLVSPEVVRLIRRMITKNESLRVEWSEILQYEVHNGQLYRHGIRERYSFLKCSNNLSDTSTTYTLPRSPQYQRNPPRDAQSRKSVETSNIKGISVSKNNNRKSTYSITSNFHGSFKKDQFVKHHMKCLDVMSLAVSLAAEDKPEALALSYLMALDVNKQLTLILDSLHRESSFKKDQTIMRNFIFIVQAELSELKTLTIYYRESLREQLDMPIELIQSHKHELLKRFVVGCEKEQLEGLVLASRVVDYIMDQLIIRRQTLEKMSRQKLLSNILTKTEVLH